MKKPKLTNQEINELHRRELSNKLNKIFQGLHIVMNKDGSPKIIKNKKNK